MHNLLIFGHNFLSCIAEDLIHLYSERFNQMKLAYGYYPIVIEHTKAKNGNGKIVGTGMLEIEQKFIHSCALVSFIVITQQQSCMLPRQQCYLANDQERIWSYFLLWGR